MAEEAAPAGDQAADLPVPLKTRMKRYIPQIVAALVATLGGFSLGTVIGWTAPAGKLIADRHYGGDTAAAEDTVGWAGGIMPLGAVAALIIMGFILDIFGRKIIMLVITIPFVASWLILAFWRQVTALYVGRFLGGFCGGSFTALAPLYIGEIAQKEIRGMLGVFFQLLLVIGILYSFALGMARKLDFLSYMNVIPNALFFVLMLFMPESPSFLLSKNKTEEAQKSLQWFRGKDADIAEELKQTQEFIEAAKARKGTIKDMFVQKTNRKAILISLLLMCCQQLSGINIVMFYATEIFRQAKTGLNEDLCTVILGLTQVVATAIAALLTDRIGRRILLLVSHAGMCVCLVVLGVYFHMHDRGMKAAENIGFLAVVCVCLYLVTFSLGSGPIPWAMLGELFPNEIKGRAGSVCALVNWLLAFMVTRTFHPLKNLLYSEGCYWLYAGLCGIATVLIFFFVIETRNKPLEQIQKELGGES